jgi:hypothetical protein
MPTIEPFCQSHLENVYSNEHLLSANMNKTTKYAAITVTTTNKGTENFLKR